MLVESYEEGRLLWDAKGWIVEAVATEIADDPKLADFKLAPSTLHRYSGTKRRLPPPIAAKIEGLKTHPKRERLTEIVEAGLRVVRGQPQPSLRDPHELALALLAHFPTDEFALKLADAVATGASGKSSPFAKLARRIARLVAKRLGSGKLDALQATCTLTDAKLDGLAAKIDRSTAEILRAVRGSGGLAGGFAGGLVVCAAVVLTNCQHVSTSAARAPQVPPAHELATVTPQPPPVVIVATLGQAGAPLVFDLRTLLGAVAGQMGEKVPPEQYVPNKVLLPGQKPPPCDAGLGEVAISGGCWFGSSDVKPPCGRLFRSGDKCYRPVAADPQKPVMVTPREPGQEVP